MLNVFAVSFRDKYTTHPAISRNLARQLINFNFHLFVREEPFIPYIDSLPSLKRNLDGPFMMPIVDKVSNVFSSIPTLRTVNLVQGILTDGKGQYS
jgi:hypothetical protein